MCVLGPLPSNGRENGVEEVKKSGHKGHHLKTCTQTGQVMVSQSPEDGGFEMPSYHIHFDLNKLENLCLTHLFVVVG